MRYYDVRFAFLQGRWRFLKVLGPFKGDREALAAIYRHGGAKVWEDMPQ